MTCTCKNKIKITKDILLHLRNLGIHFVKKTSLIPPRRKYTAPTPAEPHGETAKWDGHPSQSRYNPPTQERVYPIPSPDNFKDFY